MMRHVVIFSSPYIFRNCARNSSRTVSSIAKLPQKHKKTRWCTNLKYWKTSDKCYICNWVDWVGCRQQITCILFEFTFWSIEFIKTTHWQTLFVALDLISFFMYPSYWKDISHFEYLISMQFWNLCIFW